MPTPFTLTFPVRHYECDVYQHVNNSVYLRYLQETTLSALEQAGCGPTHMQAEGLDWRLEAIEIEYLLPLKYGDQVEVSLTPLGVQAETLVQAVEFRRGEAAELVARATVAGRWVDAESGEPTPIPIAILKSLPPEAVQGQPVVDLAFPPPPPPPPGVYVFPRQVHWMDVNARGQVDPAVLAAYQEESGMGVIAAHHWPIERLLEVDMAIMLRKNQIRYYHPARYQDELEIRTWAYDVRRVTAIRHYRVTRKSDGALLAEINGLGVWVSLKTGQPRRAPEEFLEDFRPNLVGSSQPDRS